MTNAASARDWRIFDPDELMEKVAGSESKIFEFLRVSGLSVSIYRLPVGCKDMQAPHMEDEVYYVVEGKARLKVEDKTHNIIPGSVLYVRATAAHSFFDIEEDLVVLAFFGSQR
jgi:mannose-6-phosphate isomerase-like protein (cupin superfamily)